MSWMRRDEETEGFHFWPVYSDLALSVVLVFLLFLLSQFVFNYRLQISQNLERLRIREQQAAIEEGIGRVEGVDMVIVDGNVQIITLSADFLFPTDGTQLKSEGVVLLHDLAALLASRRGAFTRVAVEGHADHRRSPRYGRSGDVTQDYGNWRLSSERAVQVVQILQGSDLPGEKLEAVGRSSYAPADTIYLRYADDPGREGNRAYLTSLERNRRIVIRLFYSELAAPVAPP